MEQTMHIQLNTSELKQSMMFDAGSSGQVNYSSVDAQQVVEALLKHVLRHVRAPVTLHWWMYREAELEWVAFDFQSEKGSQSLTICLSGSSSFLITNGEDETIEIYDAVDAFYILKKIREQLSLDRVQDAHQGLIFSSTTIQIREA
jgi:hypothetical protein